MKIKTPLFFVHFTLIAFALFSITACFPEDTDPDDDYNYQTATIGNLEWMTENLRTTSYANGDAIKTGLSNSQWANTREGAYAVYNDEERMLAAYGRLYNFYAVHDPRGICPPGWRVPTHTEWNELKNYVVSQGYPDEANNPNGAGNALKSCRQEDSPLGGSCDTTTHPYWFRDYTHHGFDAFGFAALPGGMRQSGDGSYMLAGVQAWFASYGGESAQGWWMYFLEVNSGLVRRASGTTQSGGTVGVSVRCVREIRK